jgi:hypothetical protein
MNADLADVKTDFKTLTCFDFLCLPVFNLCWLFEFLIFVHENFSFVFSFFAKNFDLSKFKIRIHPLYLRKSAFYFFIYRLQTPMYGQYWHTLTFSVCAKGISGLNISSRQAVRCSRNSPS